jgi:hypothetical protein
LTTNPSKRRVIDADNHYYEPNDCFTRHIEPAFRDRTVQVVPDADDGLGRVFIGDRRASYMSVTPTDYSSPPGALQGVFEGNYDAGYEWEAAINGHEHPALMNRDARLALMDQQGIERIVQLPTLGVVVEHEMRNDPQLVHASLSAFNRWLEDDWGYSYLNRIYGVPLLSLLDIDLAVAELDRVLSRGARLVYLKPGPQGLRSPADPIFDPFWASRRPVSRWSFTCPTPDITTSLVSSGAKRAATHLTGSRRCNGRCSTPSDRSSTRSPHWCCITSSDGFPGCGLPPSRTAPIGWATSSR